MLAAGQAAGPPRTKSCGLRRALLLSRIESVLRPSVDLEHRADVCRAFMMSETVYDSTSSRFPYTRLRPHGSHVKGARVTCSIHVKVVLLSRWLM